MFGTITNYQIKFVTPKCSLFLNQLVKGFWLLSISGSSRVNNLAKARVVLNSLIPPAKAGGYL